MVDDNAAVGETLSGMLESLGYVAHTCTDGQAAVTWCQTRCGDVDLVILDLMMPGMGGLECYRQIRAACPDVPGVIMTGNIGDTTESDLAEAQITEVLRKPFRRPDIAALAARLVKKG